MARIVLVDIPTLRDGCQLGDLVAVHGDNEELGPAYSTFRIIRVNATVAQVWAGINALIETRVGEQTAKYPVNFDDISATGTISRASFLSKIKLNG